MIKITLPIYYVIKKKRKKNERILVGMNWYRNAHYMQSNAVKHYYHKTISMLICSHKPSTVFDRVRVKYIIYPFDKSADMMNIGACIDKFLMDSLQSNKIIGNDNSGHYQYAQFEIGNFSKTSPRIQVEIEGIYHEDRLF